MMTRAQGGAKSPIVLRARHAVRAAAPAWPRVKVAHRRYTSGNGDALSGALTYALLICGAPALILSVTALKELGAPSAIAGHPVRRAAGILLPPQLADAVTHVPQLPLGLRLGLAAALAWMALRLVRALRTGVRAMCGQNAGSGSPVRDTIRDAVLGFLLLAAVIVIVYITAVVDGQPGDALVSVLCTWALFACIMLLGPWPGEGRPRVPAALRAALAAACAVGLLTLGARGYFAATAALHRELFQSAGALIGVLVWCNLVCRVLLRSVAWASTATVREPRDAA